MQSLLTLNCRHYEAAFLNAVDLAYESDCSADELQHVRDSDEWMWLTVYILNFFCHGW